MTEPDPRLARMAARIRQTRLDSGMTMDEVARKARISQPYLSQIETGVRVPAMDVLVRIADALRVTASSLLNGE